MKLATALALAVLSPIVLAQGGPPPRQSGMGGPPQGTSSRPNGPSVAVSMETETIRLLGMRSVQSDLALTSEEFNALGTIARTLRGATATEDTALAAVSKALTADQLARLKELLVQDLGYNALALADVRAKLSLSDEQVERITSLVSTTEIAKSALAASTDAASATRAKATLAAKTSAELAKVLTEDQDKKLRALAGKALGSK